MKSLWNIVGSIFGIVCATAFFGTLIWTQRSQKSVRDAVSALNAGDVVSLVVYDSDWPRGEPRLIGDREKIAAILASLKSGMIYFPAHDQQNGFERFIILKPQDIALSIYQKGEEGSAIIVKPGYWRDNEDYSTYGHLSCSSPDAWKSL